MYDRGLISGNIPCNHKHFLNISKDWLEDGLTTCDVGKVEEYYPTSKRLYHLNQTYINIYKCLLLQGIVLHVMQHLYESYWK